MPVFQRPEFRHAEFRRKLLVVAVVASLAACSQGGSPTPQPEEGQAAATGAGDTVVAPRPRTEPAPGELFTQGRPEGEADTGPVRGGTQPEPVERILLEEKLGLERAVSAQQRLSRSDLAAPSSPPPGVFTGPAPSGENYGDFDDNRVIQVAQQPVSTFSIDVDTGAYSNVRRFLNGGQLPPRDAVRTEELVNYFSYDEAMAPESNAPFGLATEMGPSPWNEGRHLLRVGVRAPEPAQGELPASNLVFLVDVSGSMNSPDKLGLLKTSLKLLAERLDAEDRVAIVVYAGASGVVLDPTAGNETGAIDRALDRLQAGGGTNGAAGIELAYQLARASFIEGGINRVLLATDGDFNVGLTDFDALVELVERQRESGIGLTTLGFGTGNYNDHLMEQLADAGNGNHAYIDTLNEARKVLVDEASSTLQTVAWDVKIQLEFNPAWVSEYRLIGYENRMLETEDFNNDRVDAGDIGAGHTVTALYELTLAGSANRAADPLRYGAVAPAAETADTGEELGYLKLRYKQPGADESLLIGRPLLASDRKERLEDTSEDFRFAVAVAGFSQLLRDNPGIGDFDYEQVLALATPARGDDPFGYRGEFLNLVRTAQVLDRP